MHHNHAACPPMRTHYKGCSGVRFAGVASGFKWGTMGVGGGRYGQWMSGASARERSRERWARLMGEGSPVEQPLRVVIARGGGDGDDGGDERICGADDDDGEALDLVGRLSFFGRRLSTAAEAATVMPAHSELQRCSGGTPAGSGLRT